MNQAPIARRRFLQAAASVPAASLATAAEVSADTQRGRTRGDWFDPERTWHFFDLWYFDRLEQLKLRQGRAVWQADATYQVPPVGNLSAWPTVYRDSETGRWRMLYSAAWKPLQLMIAESDDGRHWQPLPQAEIQPEGGKIAPHHVFTLPGGSGGGVYLDPIASDGFPFKLFVHQQGEPAHRRALADPHHRWHKLAKQVGPKRFINDEFMLVSRDGTHWETHHELRWSLADWHPEPPVFAYHNRFTQRHTMTVRPGWGDRRVCIQSTTNFESWSGPQLLLQPDLLDDELIELYGMPVFPYGDGYVGLVWIFHCESSEPTRGFNRFVGPLDCQLAFSHDGIRFERGLREPFIGVGNSGEPTGGAIEPSCLVEVGDELHLYSSASRVHHGRGRSQRGRPPGSITLHTLRKDGLTYIETRGDTGRFVSKPLVLLSPKLHVNVSAPHGEIRFQLTDLESRPVQGYTFDEAKPIASTDATSIDVEWRTGSLDAVQGKIVRLEAAIRHAKLYAIRGHFHFIDAQDRSLIQDGQPIVV